MAYDMRERMQLERLPSGVFFNARRNEDLSKAKDRQQGAKGPGRLDPLQRYCFRVAETLPTESIDGDERLYLPLLEVSLVVEVVATIALTRLTQIFTNHSTSLIPEAKYCFPLYDGSAVHEFRCWIGNDKLLQGEIKPKDTARTEYQEAVSRQRVAALLEEHTPEVFETSIGNIPPQTTVKVEILYITELKADLGGDGVLVTIPTSVAPRYGTPPVGYSPNAGIGSSATPAENGLKIQVEVSAPHPIRKLESRTHPISVELGAEGHPTSTSAFRDLAAETPSAGFDPNKARATLSDRSTSLGKDFMLLILSSGPSLLSSRALIESHPTIPDHSAMMVTINPRDLFASNLSLNDAKAEIVFVADRSGSMGNKVEGLKTAMRVFLKSIPEKCYFNICSFGSHHSLLWSQSRLATQENIDTAYQHVSNSFQADMGGTELLAALESVVQQRTTEDLNTQIIVLTDGEVWETERTIDFVRKTRTEAAEKVCFFALGIGDAVSHRLVEGIGREGGGLAEVVAVDAPGRWQSRVIRMLKGALTPSRWQCEIMLGNGSEISIPLHNLYSKFHQEPSAEMPVQAPASIQTPYRIPPLHAFSRLSIFFLLNNRVVDACKSIAIQGTAATGEKINATLPLEHVQTDKPTVHFLAARSLMNDLETGQSWLHDDKFTSCHKQNPAVFERAVQQEGENIGRQWSIVGKWTSFIAIDTGSQIENIIRLYRAERSELADLTKSRYYAVTTKRHTPSQPLFTRSQRKVPLEQIRRGPAESSAEAEAGPIEAQLGRPLQRDEYLCLGNRSLAAKDYASAFEADSHQYSTEYGDDAMCMRRVTSASFDARKATASGASRHFPKSPTSSPWLTSSSLADHLRSLTLVDLIDAQKSCGSFVLERRLGALLDQFSDGIVVRMTKYLKTGQSLFERWTMSPELLSTVCNTVLVIVYIKNKYADSADMWELVIQKASGWVQQQVPRESHRVGLYDLAVASLKTQSTHASREKADGDKDSKTDVGDAVGASQHAPESASADDDTNKGVQSKQQGDAVTMIDDQDKLDLTGGETKAESWIGLEG